MDSITLNKLLNCNYVKNLLDDSFLSILKIIFGRNQLNLRNSIAHVSYGYINYYNKYIGSLLYWLFNIVVKDYCFK